MNRIAAEARAIAKEAYVKEGLLHVVDAYSQETSAPLMSFVDKPEGPTPGAQSGDTVWQLYAFDAEADDNYLGGKGYRFLQNREGAVTLIP